MIGKAAALCLMVGAYGRDYGEDSGSAARDRTRGRAVEPVPRPEAGNGVST
jgi:hypothetical protein